MRKVLVVIGVVAVLALGTTAYAHMNGWGGGYGMGPGYGHMYGGGYGMMGPGYGPMWGSNDEETQKFLTDTADLRREMHDKMFDLREAYRSGDEEKAESIEKEVETLREKLAEKGGFTKGAKRGTGKGFGPRAGGYGYCNGPYGW